VQKRNTFGPSFQILFLALFPGVFSRSACRGYFSINICAPVSKAVTRQKPKTWEPCFSGVKVNDTQLLWAQELVVIWAIRCILGQYQGANGHQQTHEVGFLSSGLMWSAGSNCVLLCNHFNQVLERFKGNIEWFGFLWLSLLSVQIQPHVMLFTYKGA
jgi:hypothetical protein